MHSEFFSNLDTVVCSMLAMLSAVRAATVSILAPNVFCITINLHGQKKGSQHRSAAAWNCLLTRALAQLALKPLLPLYHTFLILQANMYANWYKLCKSYVKPVAIYDNCHFSFPSANYITHPNPMSTAQFIYPISPHITRVEKRGVTHH